MLGEWTWPDGEALIESEGRKIGERHVEPCEDLHRVRRYRVLRSGVGDVVRPAVDQA